MPPKKAKGGAGVGADVDAAEKRKVSELCKQLSVLKGRYLMSVSVPAGGDLDRVLAWLDNELASAGALKAPDMKRALFETANSAKDKVKAYKQVPANGLIVFAGETEDPKGKSKTQKIVIEFSPFRPIRSSLTQTGTSFNLAALSELLEDAAKANPQEEAMLTEFMNEVVRGTGKTAFGPRDTLQALQAAAVVVLIVSDTLDIRRLRVRGKQTGEEKDLYLTPAEEISGKALHPEGAEELECIESESFVQWIRDHSWVFGVELEVVTGAGEKARIFRQGYGGIGATLRYRMDFEPPEEED